MQTKLVLKQPSTLKLRFQPGSTGPAGQIVSVEATTLTPGSDATVVNNGTQEAAELVFGIPEGLKGDTGDEGDAATIAVGTTTTVANGTPASVTNVGTSSAAILDFVIPAGPAGSVTDGDKGDIVVSGGGTSWNIDAGAVGTTELADSSVTNGKLANMAAATFKLRKAGSGSGAPIDGTATEATAELNALVGDSGSGGTKGLVPAPAAGDAAADKFLKADGTWAPLVSGTVASAISGLTPSNNASTPNTHLDISPGRARDSTNSIDIILLSSITKRVDQAWAVGSGNGGIDVIGSYVAWAYLHIYLIRNPTSGVVDVLFSASATTPTMPTGYTQMRRIGALILNGSSQIFPCIWFGNEVNLKAPYQFLTSQSTSSTVAVTCVCPGGVKVKVKLLVQHYNASNLGVAQLILADPDRGYPGADTTANPNLPAYAHGYRSAVGATTVFYTLVEEWTATNRQVYIGDTSGTGALANLWIRGWTDLRDEFA